MKKILLSISSFLCSNILIFANVVWAQSAIETTIERLQNIDAMFQTITYVVAAIVILILVILLILHYKKKL